MKQPKQVSISANEQIKVNDKLTTFKQWFNGIKKFFTIKTLPPKR